MEKRLIFWLLAPVVLMGGCSRKSNPSDEGGSAPASVVSTKDKAKDVAFNPVSLDSTEREPEGGQPTAVQSGGAGSNSQVTPLNVDEGREILVQSPRPALFFTPFYPLSARMEGIEGQVVLQFLIDRTGRVVNPTVSASTVPEFNEYALEAARNWRFLPALYEGKPIDLEVAFPVSFISEKGSAGVIPGSIFSRLDLIFDTYYIDGPDGYVAAELEVTPIYRQEPQRPRDENDLPITGRVMLNFTVGTEGEVKDAKVIESTDTRLEMPALTAIRFWQFIPRMREGKPVESRVQQPVTFTLGSDAQGN